MRDARKLRLPFLDRPIYDNANNEFLWRLVWDGAALERQMEVHRALKRTGRSYVYA